MAYLALTLSYTMFWRRVALLDITAIAGGFVLRALAGGVAAPVTLSRWFVLVISFAALFVAAGKRRSELARSTRDGGSGTARAGAVHRQEPAAAVDPQRHGGAVRLQHVGVPVAEHRRHSLATVDRSSRSRSAWLATEPLIQAGEGEAPEEIVLKDRRLQLAGLVWLILFALSVNAAVRRSTRTRAPTGEAALVTGWGGGEPATVTDAAPRTISMSWTSALGELARAGRRRRRLPAVLVAATVTPRS